MKLPTFDAFSFREISSPLALFVVLFLTLRPVWADCLVTVVNSHAREAGFTDSRYPTRAEAEYAVQHANVSSSCFSITCSDDSSSTNSNGTAPPSGLSPLNQSAYSLGEALGNQIRADDAAAKEKADELERQRVQREKEEAEQRRLKYEASKKELLGNLRDSSNGPEGGSREAGSSGDNSGLRDVGSDEGFMQAPAPKRPKVKHVASYKTPAKLTPRTAHAPAPKPTPTPKPKEEVAGVQHADLLKDGVHLTGKPAGPLKDEIWVDNTSGDPVDVHIWMAGESKNSAHSLRNTLHLEPGETVKVGWAANTTNEDPWNYQLGINVTKK